MEGVDVAGIGDDVTVNEGVGVQKLGVTVKVLVDVAGMGVFVIVTAGVLVATLGTQST